MPPADNLARKAIVIPASRAPEEVKLRVAAYCRVSSDSEDQRNSFAAQNAYYTEFITGKKNWELVDIYADEGITGTSAKKRPDFQRLLNDCRKGRIDKVLVKSISRFARNTKDCLEVTRELKALGISVVFEEQNIDTAVVSGEMLTAVFAACAQAESQSISKNLKWSYQKRRESGRFITQKYPFGYRLIDGQLVIDENEATVVQKIFHLYLCGWSTVDIAEEIKKMGIPTRDGLPTWGHATVKYILQNEKYVGDALLQKKYATDAFPSEIRINKGEKAQYYISHSHPPIITREAFEAAQALYQSKRPQIVGTPRLQYNFTQMIFCGNCGTGFKHIVNREKSSWVCMCHSRGGNCSMPPIPETELCSAFLRCYYNLKHEGQAILTELQDNLLTIRSRQMLWHPDVIELNKQISTLTSQSHMLTVLNQQGAVDPDIFISQSNQLAQQLRKAKRQKEKLLEQDGNDTLSKTRELQEILSYGPESLDAFDGELFRELVDRIIVESNTRLRFRLINGLELPEEIERTVR